MHSHKDACMFNYTHTHMHTCTHRHTHTPPHTHTHTHICTYTHTHTCAHAHTHTHTPLTDVGGHSENTVPAADQEVKPDHLKLPYLKQVSRLPGEIALCA